MNSHWKPRISLRALLWLRAFISLTAPIWLAVPAQAESVSDLLSRLNQLDGNRPVKAQVASELWHADGKDGDREEYEVAVDMVARSGPEGYQLHYDTALLERLESESEKLVEDPDTLTKTTDFMWRVELNEIRPLLDAASELRRELQSSEFSASQQDTYNDQPATRLTFDQDKQVIDGRVRKYVNHFDSTLEIWVDEEGTPLASRLKRHVKGSILFVIRGEYQDESTHHYDIVNDRLIIRQLERWRKADLPGEHYETQLSQRLTPLTDQ